MAKIATEGGGWRGAAERWLQGLGYPAACIETPMSGFVDEWWRYYRSEADFYVSELRDVNGTPHTVKVRSCTPARMVCEDMAGLIYNERASVSVAEDGQAGQAAEWLAGWLARTRFDDGAPQLVQRMCATGTGAWALHLRGVQAFGRSPGLGVSPQRYDARHIAPLDWDGEECTACAFVSQVAVRGELLTQVEVHRPNDRGDYEIMTRFFRDDGETVVPDGYSDGAISTRQPRKTFELVTLALDNPYWEGSPFGVALFDAALGAVSYTHLDVYKRQERAFERRMGSEEEGRRPMMKSVCPGCGHEQACGHADVTHCADRVPAAWCSCDMLRKACLLYTSRCV